MKRIGNLYEKIYCIDNLKKADLIAQKGKSNQFGVIKHNENSELNIQRLHEMLKNKTYSTSKYTTFTIFEPKERLIFKLPYYPDRIKLHFGTEEELIKGLKEILRINHSLKLLKDASNTLPYVEEMNKKK